MPPVVTAANAICKVPSMAVTTIAQPVPRNEKHCSLFAVENKPFFKGSRARSCGKVAKRLQQSNRPGIFASVKTKASSPLSKRAG